MASTRMVRLGAVTVQTEVLLMIFHLSGVIPASLLGA
jgi:hypothetical protein